MKLCAILLALLALPTAVQANDRYYLLVFAGEGNPPIATNCHTFATVVKVKDQNKAGMKHAELEVHTISWLPETLRVAVLAPPEPGKNLDLPSTFAWIKSIQGTVFLWGPYEVKKELYDMARQQAARLNSGQVAYKALDRRFRPNAINCMHAVADLDSTQGMLLTGTAFGVPASAMVVQHLAKWRVDDQTHPWLIERLGLGDHQVRLEVMDRKRKDEPKGEPRVSKPAD